MDIARLLEEEFRDIYVEKDAEASASTVEAPQLDEADSYTQRIEGIRSKVCQ